MLVKLAAHPTDAARQVYSKDLYVIRAQRKGAYLRADRKVSEEGYKIVYRTRDPNPGNMLIRVRRDLKDIARFDHNNIRVSAHVSVNEFLTRVDEIKKKAIDACISGKTIADTRK